MHNMSACDHVENVFRHLQTFFEHNAVNDFLDDFDFFICQGRESVGEGRPLSFPLWRRSDGSILNAKIHLFGCKQTKDSRDLLPGEPKHPCVSITIDGDHLEWFYTQFVNVCNLARSMEIFQQTPEQSLSFIWHTHRTFRVTASDFNKIMRWTRDRCLSKEGVMVMIRKWLLRRIKREIMGNSFPEFTSDAMKHGIKCEPLALKLFNEVNAQNHLQAYPCGILVLPRLSWLAASADGVVIDSKGRVSHVLEIKSLYMAHTGKLSLDEAYARKLPLYLKYVGESQCLLRTSHDYYGQVQLQMALYNVAFAQLLVYGSFANDMKLLTVARDDEYMRRELKNVSETYFNIILPMALVLIQILDEIGSAAFLERFN
jgi:YqaJ-like viral recombinase domain